MFRAVKTCKTGFCVLFVKRSDLDESLFKKYPPKCHTKCVKTYKNLTANTFLNSGLVQICVFINVLLSI